MKSMLLLGTMLLLTATVGALEPGEMMPADLNALCAKAPGICQMPTCTTDRQAGRTRCDCSADRKATHARISDSEVVIQCVKPEHLPTG